LRSCAKFVIGDFFKTAVWLAACQRRKKFYEKNSQGNLKEGSLKGGGNYRQKFSAKKRKIKIKNKNKEIKIKQNQHSQNKHSQNQHPVLRYYLLQCLTVLQTVTKKGRNGSANTSANCYTSHGLVSLY